MKAKCGVAIAAGLLLAGAASAQSNSAPPADPDYVAVPDAANPPAPATPGEAPGPEAPPPPAPQGGAAAGPQEGCCAHCMGGEPGAPGPSAQQAPQPAEPPPGTLGAGTSEQPGIAPPYALQPARPHMSAGEIRTHAIEALAAIDSASAELKVQNTEQARQDVSRAKCLLQTLYDGAPLAHLAARFEATRMEFVEKLAETHGKFVDVDMAPLIAGVNMHSDSLEPRVVALVNAARNAQRKGDSRRAAWFLGRAEGHLAWDASLVPIANAYSRVAAAEMALDDGAWLRARRLLIDVRSAAVQTAMRAPLTPIRFDLRAAAVAAHDNDQTRAGDLTRQAADNLRSLSRTVEPASQELITMTYQTDHLEQKIALGETVKPEALLKIAQRTQVLGASRG